MNDLGAHAHEYGHVCLYSGSTGCWTDVYVYVMGATPSHVGSSSMNCCTDFGFTHSTGVGVLHEAIFDGNFPKVSWLTDVLLEGQSDA